MSDIKLADNISVNTASVKVMRSYDYCHFEICLSSDHIYDLTDVDDLRKEAAKLADKAVEQYKAAKQNAEEAKNDEYRLSNLKRRAADAEVKPEGDRTPEEKAAIKHLQDGYYQNRRSYDYSDDWDEQDWNEDNDDTGF